MSLFTTHSPANRVVDTGLLVTYSKSRISGSWTYGDYFGTASTTYTEMMEYHRRATKSYRYIAMTEEAARKCVKKMVELYTRSIKISGWNTNTGTWSEHDGGDILMADIARQRNDDGSWDVLINVNEDDVRHEMIGRLSPGFLSEQQREYDDEKEEVPTLGETTP